MGWELECLVGKRSEVRSCCLCWVTSSHPCCRDNKFVAIKALTGYQTGLIFDGIVRELETLETVSSSSSPHCLKLDSHFIIPGKGSAGIHLYLVTQLLGGDVRCLYRSKGREAFPLPLAKRMLLHMLRGIAHAHKCGVVHTDLKHDNIFFDNALSVEEIENIIKSDPPRRHDPEMSYDGTVSSAVSQPLPMPTLEEAMKRTFVLADFGSGRCPRFK